jgi:hypothetical protein
MYLNVAYALMQRAKTCLERYASRWNNCMRPHAKFNLAKSKIFSEDCCIEEELNACLENKAENLSSSLSSDKARRKAEIQRGGRRKRTHGEWVFAWFDLWLPCQRLHILKVGSSISPTTPLSGDR